jgi:hypothetical protein
MRKHALMTSQKSEVMVGFSCIDAWQISSGLMLGALMLGFSCIDAWSIDYCHFARL